MRITPSKNYKKPLYAIGLTAAIAAMSVAGCTDPGRGRPVDYAGDIDTRPIESTTETTPLELDGEVAMTEPTESKETKDAELITAGIVPNNIESAG